MSSAASGPPRSGAPSELAGGEPLHIPSPKRLFSLITAAGAGDRHRVELRLPSATMNPCTADQDGGSPTPARSQSTRLGDRFAPLRQRCRTGRSSTKTSTAYIADRHRRGRLADDGGRSAPRSAPARGVPHALAHCRPRPHPRHGRACRRSTRPSRSLRRLLAHSLVATGEAVRQGSRLVRTAAHCLGVRVRREAGWRGLAGSPRGPATRRLGRPPRLPR